MSRMFAYRQFKKYKETQLTGRMKETIWEIDRLMSGIFTQADGYIKLDTID